LTPDQTQRIAWALSHGIARMQTTCATPPQSTLLAQKPRAAPTQNDLLGADTVDKA
jgi:hypothetical protein